MWLLIGPLIVAAQILTVDLPRPVELGQDSVAVTLIGSNDAGALRRMSTIVADPAENLVLRLRGVEADQDPGVSWEVYVASSDETDCDNVPALAGILSLYGAPPDTEFVLPLDAAIVAGEPVGLEIIFKPTSGLEVEGVPVPPIVRTPVRIGGITLEIERATRGNHAHQPTFTLLRQLIAELVPDAEVSVKWGTVAYDLDGSLFALSASKKHVNLYILTVGLLAEYSKELAGIPQSKCVLRFGSGAEVPLETLRKVMTDAVERKRAG